MQMRLERMELWCAGVARRIAFVGVAAMLTIAVSTILDILLRAVFNAPISGFNEVVEVVMAIAIAACFPAGFAQRSHLIIDFLAGNVPARIRPPLKLLGALLLLLLYVLMAWRMGAVAWDMADTKRTTMILVWPVAPAFWSISALFFLAALVQMVVLLVDLCADFPTAKSRVTAVAGLTGIFALILSLAYSNFFSFVLQSLLSGNAVLLSLILFGLLWILIVFLVPVAAAMGLIGLSGTILVIGLQPALTVVGTETVEFLTNVNLAVLPLFLLMGSFASVSGLSSDIYGLAHALIGHRRGGLALATVGGCAGFGALTGSSLATAVTIGRVALPEMLQRGYHPGFATGTVAAGGTLGQLVPPSAAIVVFAILVEESIGRLFIAAIVPAIVATVLYIITVQICVRVNPTVAPGTGRLHKSDVIAALRRASVAIALFIVVIGGIYGGIFTATEAAAVGAAGAFLIALVRGRLGGSAFWQVMGETAATTALIYALILSAVLFSFFVGASGVPTELTGFVRQLALHPYAVVALLLLFYLVLGAVMDPFAMMVITVPIVAPLVTDLGFDIIWWGIVMVSVVETGLITPPFGMNVFVLRAVVPDVPLPVIFKGVLPFVVADIVRLVLLVAFPMLALWLPSTMMT